MLQRGRNLKRITNQPGKNWKLPKWRPYSLSKLSKCSICTNGRESLNIKLEVNLKRQILYVSLIDSYSL